MNSKFTLLVRKLLGLLLIVFGSNKLLHFIPQSQPTGTAAHFLNTLNATGYVFPTLGVLEMFIGIMLLLKKWDAFVLIMLAPISINIVLFHLFLNIPDVNPALLIASLNGILIYKNRKLYSPLFMNWAR